MLDNKLRSSDEKRIAEATSFQEKDMTAFSLDFIGRVKNGKFVFVAKHVNGKKK